ncbi:MAG: condensation domain-containing protein, partial [Melioribacteraceae bacterium]|nr:condensation domain-containing protein [Melioribacteraceae bacterium]
MSDISKRIENLPPDKLSKLIAELRKRKSNGGTHILPRNNKNIYPMSFAQSRLWFLHQLQPDSSFYIIPAILKITGDLNVTYLEKSFNEIIKRHEVLRSYFPEENGEPNQKLHNADDFNIKIFDYKDNSEFDSLEISDLALKYTANQFDLRKDYLFNVNLLRISNDEHILFITMHHIIADGWSIKIFVNEFIALYEGMVNGKAADLPEITIQYTDFAEWQNSQLKKGIYDEQYSYWKEKLLNMPQTIDLPIDRPRPKIQTYSGKKIKFTVEKEIVTKIAEYGVANGFTPFMVLLTSFQIFLSKISNQEDFGIGIPFVNRNNDETKQLIGFFINTLVIRAELDPHCSFTNSTMKAKNFLLSAMANSDLPFEKVVETVEHEKDLSFSPLFQVMFDYQDKPLKSFTFAGVKAKKIEGEVTSTKFDLMLSIENNGDSLVGAFEFNTNLFDASTIERFILYYKKLLRGLLSEP